MVTTEGLLASRNWGQDVAQHPTENAPILDVGSSEVGPCERGTTGPPRGCGLKVLRACGGDHPSW